MKKLLLTALLLAPSLGMAADSVVKTIDHKNCTNSIEGSVKESDFLIFISCGDAGGNDIGIINTHRGDKLEWQNGSRFWEDNGWSHDVTSYARLGDKLYVASGYIIGSNKLFELDLATRTQKDLDAKTAVDSDIVITRADGKAVYYKLRDADGKIGEELKIELK